MSSEKKLPLPYYFLDEIGFHGTQEGLPVSTQRQMKRTIDAFLRKEKKEAERARKEQQKAAEAAQKAQ